MDGGLLFPFNMSLAFKDSDKSFRQGFQGFLQIGDIVGVSRKRRPRIQGLSFLRLRFLGLSFRRSIL